MRKRKKKMSFLKFCEEGFRDLSAIMMDSEKSLILLVVMNPTTWYLPLWPSNFNTLNEIKR